VARQRLSKRIREILTAETRAGIITITMALIALAWVNSPLADSYSALTHWEFGFPGLTLSLHAWAADFMLAFFFLVVGIELRHEFTKGSLNSPRKALVPVMAALGGMVIPALIFVAFNYGQDTIGAWGIPMATDIAFALAVLALVAPKSKPELRTFLLALAVVDDLGAILVIALFYTPGLNVAYLFAAAALLAAFALIQKTALGNPILLTALGLGVWWLVHESGVHATIAGVAIGLLLTTAARKKKESLADRALKAIHPVSTYVAVPLFVLVSSGVSLAVIGGFATTSPLFAGIVAGLLFGKPLGIVLFAWIGERFLGGQRDPALRRKDLWLIGTISSIGFTVALLINDLALAETSYAATGTAAVVVAAVIGSIASFVVARRVNA
jgi:Na+:H+ antiporter, NhaA family